VQLVLAIEYVGLPLAHLTNSTKHAEPLPRLTLQAVCRQTLVCLAEVHAKQIVHGDVKPANLTWHAQSAHVKLIDFGHAFSFGETSGPIQSFGYRAPEVALTVSSEATLDLAMPSHHAPPDLRLGSAPLCTSGCGASAAVDVWSAGCIFRELSRGVPLAHASSTDRLFFERFYELTDSCLQPDPSMRCSAADALHHPFFACASAPACSLMRSTLILPTTAIIVIGILADDLDCMVTGASSVHEVLEEVQSECAHFGDVECFFGAKLLEGSVVYIRYALAEQAERAWRVLNTRTFDGTALTAIFATVDFEVEALRLDVRLSTSLRRSTIADAQ
jgi:serine/threonine protein kinase